MSYYEEIKNARTKLANAVIPNSQNYVRCRHCIEHPRLQVRNNVGVCVRGCGQTFRLEERIDQETDRIILVPTTTMSKVVKSGGALMYAGGD
jgi:hypothetical protein